MYYGKLNKHDIANGEGVRVSLFVSGCPHRCKGCFNPETWDYNYGEPFTDDIVKELIKALRPAHIEGLTILGGEPLAEKNLWEVLGLCGAMKRLYPHKSIWVYTGYTYEELPPQLLKDIDVLVDGRFIESKKDITLKFRGSSNQRIIDVPKSLKAGEVVLKEV